MTTSRVRLSRRGWALIAPVLVVLSIVAIGAVGASADVITRVALLLPRLRARTGGARGHGPAWLSLVPTRPCPAGG